jgi:hypothetical protein
MEHNIFYLPNEQFILSGEVFISWLGPADLYNPELGWYYTAEGEIFLLHKSADSQYTFAEKQATRPVKFSSMSDIKDYVRHAVTQLSKSSNIVSSTLSAADAICLSIYPGFITTTNGGHRTAEILQVLCNSIESSNPGIAGKLLAHCIFQIASSSDRATSLIRHCISHMPPQFVGLICAHGLASRRLWRSRHRDALIQGWRFQLENPTQMYGMTALSWETNTSKCLIERDIFPNERSILLAETGLTEADINAAQEIADVVSTESTSSRTAALLTVLMQRSNLRTLQHAPADLGSLGPLVD